MEFPLVVSSIAGFFVSGAAQGDIYLGWPLVARDSTVLYKIGLG